jgi:hypothetical protein
VHVRGGETTGNRVVSAWYPSSTRIRTASSNPISTTDELMLTLVGRR